MGSRARSRSRPVTRVCRKGASVTTTGLIVSLMRRAYSSASADSDTPRANASARRLATTLHTIGMADPRRDSRSRMGNRRRRSYSSTSAMTSYSSDTGSVTRTTSSGNALA